MQHNKSVSGLVFGLSYIMYVLYAFRTLMYGKHLKLAYYYIARYLLQTTSIIYINNFQKGHCLYCLRCVFSNRKELAPEASNQ